MDFSITSTLFLLMGAPTNWWYTVPSLMPASNAALSESEQEK
jgi:hypothetical protein